MGAADEAVAKSAELGLRRAQINQQAGAVFHDGSRINWPMKQLHGKCAPVAVDEVSSAFDVRNDARRVAVGEIGRAHV